MGVGFRLICAGGILPSGAFMRIAELLASSAIGFALFVIAVVLPGGMAVPIPAGLIRTVSGHRRLRRRANAGQPFSMETTHCSDDSGRLLYGPSRVPGIVLVAVRIQLWSSRIWFSLTSKATMAPSSGGTSLVWCAVAGCCGRCLARTSDGQRNGENAAA